MPPAANPPRPRAPRNDERRYLPPTPPCEYPDTYGPRQLDRCKRFYHCRDTGQTCLAYRIYASEEAVRAKRAGCSRRVSKALGRRGVEMI